MLSFKRLIEDNYKHEIENRIILLLKENPKKFGLAYYKRSDFKEIELINLVIARIFINDYKPNELELIIQVRMTWLVTVEADERWEQFTPWANLSTFFKIDEKNHEMGTLSYSRYKETNTPYPLDDYLVPVISRKQREGIAERLLEIYYKEVLEDEVALEPEVLCSRLNLEILPLPLDKEDSRIRGQVYFRESSISTIENGVAKIIPIRRGTIVVDDQLLKEKGQGAYNFTIVHECIHWILHQKAAMLANIIHSNMTADENLHLNNQGKNSHSHMETQANGIASCMMIPKKMCIEKVEQSQEDYLRFSKLLHFIEEDPEEQALSKIEWAVREIANIYKVSITSAKIRLIDLGYEEAMGVLNYVDGRYLTRYAFSEGSLSKNETVSIKERDFLKLLETSPEFRTEIHNRNYIYIDSHVIKNEEKYLQEDEEGQVYLTSYARHHMDECCLIFKVDVISNGISSYDFYNSGILYHKPDTQLRFSIAYPSEIHDKEGYVREVQENLYDFLSELPHHFPKAVSKIMEYYDYTQEEMAEYCDLSIEKLRELKNRDDVNHSLETIMQFCVGMRLPPHFSIQLISISGHRLTNSRRDLMYQTLLYGVAGGGLEECNEYLIAYRQPPLGKTAKKIYNN